MKFTIGARLAALALLAACAAQAPSDARFPAEQRPLVARIIAAEDARGRGAEGLAPLMEGIRSEHAGIRRLAVRSLGRLERDSLAAAIEPLLADTVAGVRAEAANALGQARRAGDAAAARAMLAARLATEDDPYVRGVLAQTLGRLPHGSPDEVRATATLLTRVDAGAADSALVALAKGFFHLARQPAARGTLPPDAVGRIRLLARHEGNVGGPARRVRTLGAAALFAARVADAADAAHIMYDHEPLVRREAAAALPLLAGDVDVHPLVLRALADTSAIVLIEGLRSLARIGPAATGCEMSHMGTRDEEPRVVLLSLDLMATVCTPASAVASLNTVAASLGKDPGQWHAPAHALAALAALDPASARRRIPAFTSHASPFVRSWAARAAAAAADTATLRTLADDEHPNVRTDAIAGLAALGAADASLLVRQLAHDDGQLLMTVAAALEGERDSTVLPALLDALDRVSGERRETSRDARSALLRRIGELGGPDHAQRVRPYLRDFDPEIASLAAEVLTTWTGGGAETAPQPLSPAVAPTPEQLDSLAQTTVVLIMEDGREIEVRLRPWVAPTNAVRFARLAAAGYYDGLTFHRVVPNFVVQGGSPAANEYAGDAPFTRDELGINGNWRGTVGLSTRGRDTGDAQLYVNLIDNIRLDHDYTVFGEVVRGMDVVDSLLEGAVIRSVQLR